MRNCPTGKICYRSKKIALTGMNRIINKNVLNRPGILGYLPDLKAVYKCKYCRDWHTTSKPRLDARRNRPIVRPPTPST